MSIHLGDIKTKNGLSDSQTHVNTYTTSLLYAFDVQWPTNG